MFFYRCVLLLTACFLTTTDAVISAGETRVSVIRGDDGTYFGFINENGKLSLCHSDNSTTWSDWSAVNTSTKYPELISNPVSIIDGHTKTIVVYAQAKDGQVYTFSTGATIAVTRLTTDIPRDANSSSPDGVKVLLAHNYTHVFVRSQSKNSRIYYGYQDWVKGVWSKFVAIGDDSNYLMYDFTVVENTFLKRLEVFAVVGDKKVKHTWQNSYTSFGDDWHEIVLIGSPEFNSAPVAHSMGRSDLNGMIEVFARDGNRLRHIHQTTCDKVHNPWGPCTWEVAWHDLGGDIPSGSAVSNPLTISKNIHNGLEIFVIGQSDGALYHIWQPERRDSWTDWESLGTFPSGAKFVSLPYIAIDTHGWWEAFGLTSAGNKMAKFVQGEVLFTVTPPSQKYGSNETVSWQVPADQATSEDWIGVYQKDAPNHKYVNFRYVGGGQNPKSDPVHKGTLQLISLLPNGIYDYRYLVNREYDNVTSVSAEVVGAPSLQEWVQLYQGIARGLGNLSTNLTKCVKDGNTTIVKFEQSFKAFEDRKIIDGMHLFAEALKDVVETLTQCEETAVAEKITKFIADLISCTESNCDKFVIDLLKEILIIYERYYEIYGDIQAAKNCFDINAYEMGGLCVGRVTWACLAAPDYI